MKTFIILLRGVMPTGKNKVPMGPLRTALESVGLREVRTYIQSGNVIARSSLSQEDLETLVHETIRDTFGGDIKVMARTSAQMSGLLKANPFPNTDPKKLYFTILSRTPDVSLLRELQAQDYSPDRIQFIGSTAYLLCAETYSSSRLNNNYIERKLKLSATTRVYNTIAKLVELTLCK